MIASVPEQLRPDLKLHRILLDEEHEEGLDPAQWLSSKFGLPLDRASVIADLAGMRGRTA
jgi:hypothetical protein